jgi:poly(A) polymerase/tRNA nucleotidyltransferase (CCA-adding enzyme)
MVADSAPKGENPKGENPEGGKPGDEPRVLGITPPDFLADPALRAVMNALPGARVVGGAVRDALAGRPVADVDLATRMRPGEVVRRLVDAGLKAAPTGVEHGTVTAIADHRGFEVTTLRRDVETDGRHAVVDFTDDWRADASRRDFTINALSMTADGSVYDYFGGVADLHAGVVRFVGEAAERIVEDYLRILRFFRFHARYGTGKPDAAALAAIRAHVDGIDRLSVERVWSEFRRILLAPEPSAAVALMAEAGVLAKVLPEGARTGRLERLVAEGAPADPLLRLAALADGDAAALARGLRLASSERDRLLALRAGGVPPDDADDDALRRALADTPGEILLGRAWLAGRSAALRERLAAIPRPTFPLRGRDLRAAGVAPGERLGELLREIRCWWMCGGCIADAAACRAELARRLALPSEGPEDGCG